VISLLLVLPSLVQAEEPVHFVDAALKAVIEAELWIPDPTPTDMLGLTSLNLSNKGIVSLIGLEYATNLETLWVRWNQIADLSPLSSLIKLRHLDAHGNGHIPDLSPLSSLVNLEELVLRDNRIIDISPLSSLARLERLHIEWNRVNDVSALSSLPRLDKAYLEFNEITDLTPLSRLTSLTYLNVEGNPLGPDACLVHIPQILANNPGIDLRHDECTWRRAVFAARLGGFILSPGEGEFVYRNGETVFVQAQARPGFTFAGFSGTMSTPHNPTTFAIRQDVEIYANFVSTLDTIHVDDDGRDDPGPGSLAVSDVQENGTGRHPFDGIQKAIDVAADGATIFVHAGTYHENIDLLGKHVKLTGFDPNDPGRSVWPVIDGGGNAPVVSFTHKEEPNCELRGFVIMAAEAQLASAVQCSTASPTIANCLIIGNRVSAVNGAVVYCTDSRATLLNCTVADNYGGWNGAALHLENSPVQVVNSILWANAPNPIVAAGVAAPSIRYSCIVGGWPGPGNIDTDPLFARAGTWVNRLNPDLVVTPDHPDAMFVMGDYHLQSQAGRWDPGLRQWVQDAATSPCINAGDPASPVGDEPVPNGGIIDMGVYGGTAETAR
jgi:hypothetical protein